MSKTPGRKGLWLRGYSRDDLIGMVAALRPKKSKLARCLVGEEGLSFRTRASLLHVLVLVIEQMEPKRDTRVHLLPWQIAMLAEALCKDGASTKAARFAAIKTFAPEHVDDTQFSAFIEHTHNLLRRGKNPARHQLGPVIHPDVLAFGKQNLK